MDNGETLNSFYSLSNIAIESNSEIRIREATKFLHYFTKDELLEIFRIVDVTNNKNTLLHKLLLHASPTCDSKLLQSISFFINKLYDILGVFDFDRLFYSTNDKGNTPLHITAFGHSTIFKLLINLVSENTILSLLLLENNDGTRPLDYIATWQSRDYLNRYLKSLSTLKENTKKSTANIEMSYLRKNSESKYKLHGIRQCFAWSGPQVNQVEETKEGFYVIDLNSPTPQRG